MSPAVTSRTTGAPGVDAFRGRRERACPGHFACGWAVSGVPVTDGVIERRLP